MEKDKAENSRWVEWDSDMVVDTSILMSNFEVARKDPGFPDTIISFTNDSRRIKPGDVFIAVAGTQRPGTDFLPDAQQRGAIAAIVDASLTVPAGVSIPILTVPDARYALSLLAREYYGDPSEKLLVDAMVGTKGKTTATYMARLVMEAGFGEGKAGIIGTSGAFGGGVSEITGLTTPESIVIQRLLAEFLEAGIKQVSMEYTAHGIALNRGMHVKFNTGVFISFSQDHLDFFGTMEDYRAVKERFFRDHADDENFIAIVNIDDPAAMHFIDAMGGRALTYGYRGEGDIRADNLVMGTGTAEFDLAIKGETVPVRMNIIGKFNVTNALAAASLGVRHGIPIKKIAQGLMAFESVPGRLEPIDEGQPFDVLIDFAHSPESVKVVLESISDLGYRHRISVMGAGGDRDRSKRPLIGQRLIYGSDIVIVTSDNPRTENPNAIVEEILQGIKGSGTEKEYHSEPDRRKAIKMAFEMAEPEDVVLILGKGAEDYQEINGVKYPFDDRDVCTEILREMRDSWS